MLSSPRSITQCTVCESEYIIFGFLPGLLRTSALCISLLLSQIIIRVFRSHILSFLIVWCRPTLQVYIPDLIRPRWLSQLCYDNFSFFYVISSAIYLLYYFYLFFTSYLFIICFFHFFHLSSINQTNWNWKTTAFSSVV